MVFNCSKQMNYQVMVGITKGLAKSGCWGCFDEFDRIDVEVLSVVALQISCVLDAMKHMRASFAFPDGSSVELHRECGFFITTSRQVGRQACLAASSNGPHPLHPSARSAIFSLLAFKEQ